MRGNRAPPRAQKERGGVRTLLLLIATFPQPFPLLIALCRGRVRSHDRHHGPPSPQPRNQRAKAIPPLWQYLSPLRQEKADESIPDPKGRESRTPGTFITACFRDRTRGP
jgi:hypothetical protein